MEALFTLIKWIINVLGSTLLTAFLIYAVYSSYYNIKIALIKRMQYSKVFSVNGVFEGEELTITETIFNNSPLPMFFIDVESYIYNSLELIDSKIQRNSDSAMQLVVSRFHLLPYMQIKRHYKVKCNRRGYYKLNTAQIVTKSYAAATTAYFDFDSQLYVYPKPIESGQLSYPVNLLQGSYMSARRVMQDPFLISGIRNYTSGDTFNMINFKATARTGFQGNQGIMVNKLDYSSSRIFIIYINFQEDIGTRRIPTPIYESIMEQGLSLAASFISEALRSNYRVGLSANCMMANGDMYVDHPVVGGLYHLEEMLMEMAGMQTRCGISFKALLDSKTRVDISDAEIFIITPCIDRSVDNSMALFRRRNNAVTVIKLDNPEFNEFAGAAETA